MSAEEIMGYIGTMLSDAPSLSILYEGSYPCKSCVDMWHKHKLNEGVHFPPEMLYWFPGHRSIPSGYYCQWCLEALCTDDLAREKAADCKKLKAIMMGYIDEDGNHIGAMLDEQASLAIIGDAVYPCTMCLKKTEPWHEGAFYPADELFWFPGYDSDSDFFYSYPAGYYCEECIDDLILDDIAREKAADCESLKAILEKAGVFKDNGQ